MPPTFGPALRACCVAGALLFTSAFASDAAPSLIGSTRGEVVARLGEPRSRIVAGTREVLFFADQRVVLRHGRVVEIEPLEVVTPPPSEPVPSSTRAEDTETGSAAEPGDTAAPPGEASPDEPPQSAEPAAPAAPAEPELVIKSVRPRPRSGLTGVRADPAAVPARAPQSEPERAMAEKTSSASRTEPPATASTASTADDRAVAAPAAAAESAPAALRAPPAVVPSAEPASVAAAPVVAPAEANAATDPDAENPLRPEAEATAAEYPGRDGETPATPGTAPAEIIDEAEGAFTLSTYVIALVIIGTGVGYLLWRRRQRELELAASAVSRPPFATETAGGSGGSRFSAELLGKLEWKRFEDLVASYYNKTGVVAQRTRSGPDAAVHIRISWKGEQRPFACVQCIARPTGLIESAPIRALCEAIAGEDIRRGYVVTSGKFGVPARDLAEEKHITLLAGDVFLEKLNALPEPARAELLREATAGDYTTPTCSRCDIKMSRSTTDSTLWQCVQCGLTLPR